MKNNLSTFAMVLIVAVLGAGFFVWERFALRPVSTEPGSITIDVAPGANFYSIRRQLLDQGLSINPIALRVWIRVSGAGRKLRVGEYVVQKNWSQLRILNEVLLGTPLLHKFTIKEGFNIWDIKEEFAQAWPGEKPGAFEALITNPKWLERMGVPMMPKGVRRTLEGFLFPETYSYQKYDTPEQIFQAMLGQFEQRVLPALQGHPWGKTAEGRYRLLTLASIVEKESGNPQEQPLVASVFWNRLKKHMKLQSDPTTMYALFPDFDGRLRKIHLTTPSAYNTYTLAELPAGPISNPGETAIRAVLAPATTDYLYFVSKNDGSHVFSADYKTHAANVTRYQLGGGESTHAKGNGGDRQSQ